MSFPFTWIICFTGFLFQLFPGVVVRWMHSLLASLKHRKDADMFCLSFKWFVIFYILLLYSAPGYKVDTFFIVEVGSGNWTDFDLFHQIDFETWSKHIDKRLLLTFKHGTHSERSPLTLRTLIKIFEQIKSKSLQYKTNRSRHLRNLCWL